MFNTELPFASRGPAGGGSLLAQIKAGKQLNKVDIEALRKVAPWVRFLIIGLCTYGPYSQRRKRNSSMSLSVIAQTLRAAIDLKFDEDDDDDEEEAGSSEGWEDEDVWDEDDL